MRKVGFILLVGFTFLFSLSAASAEINVSPMVINFTKQGKRYHDISIYNNATTDAYVKVSLEEIENPGKPDQKMVPFVSNPVKFGLVATPNRLIIPPKSSAYVRVLPLINNGDQDHVYMINIIPTQGQIEKVKGPGKIKAAIVISVGYGVRVVVRPNDPTPKVVLSRSGNKVIAKNMGNTNVVLYDVEACQAGKCKTLNQISAVRLYAQRQTSFSVPAQDKVKIKQDFMGKISTLKLN